MNKIWISTLISLASGFANSSEILTPQQVELAKFHAQMEVCLSRVNPNSVASFKPIRDSAAEKALASIYGETEFEEMDHLTLKFMEEFTATMSDEVCLRQM
ncbi:hypothetical protein [Motilimonas pumila]|uniref:Uncharacterized protein n=1 Tax=Motilimonas pumila TaxID=2303987 RepID=A0A418YBJ9_9GAMM|nr:hypothetical protein [Motilimonas pumila]RJG40296.1 hypothetical protein D1Z90_16200 [Motilimonas pumila]